LVEDNFPERKTEIAFILNSLFKKKNKVFSNCYILIENGFKRKTEFYNTLKRKGNFEQKLHKNFFPYIEKSKKS